MLPTPKSAHIDAALTSIAIAYQNQQYIADRVFPNVSVAKASDYFFKFLKGAWFRNEAKVRGAGASAAESGYQVTSDTYACIERALRHPIPIELINNADNVLTPLTTGVRFVMNGVMLAKEIACAAACLTASVWTTEDDTAAGWVGDTNSTFYSDILANREVIRQLIGRYPNRLVMDSKTWKNIRHTPEILERIMYGGTQAKPADITKQMVAALLELDEIVVGSAIYSSDEETVAGTEFTAVDVWEQTATKGSALLYYAPSAPAIEKPAAGYCFNFRGHEGAPIDIAESDTYRAVKRWWNDEKAAWYVQAFESFDVKVTCADAAVIFADTLIT